LGAASADGRARGASARDDGPADAARRLRGAGRVRRRAHHRPRARWSRRAQPGGPPLARPEPPVRRRWKANRGMPRLLRHSRHSTRYVCVVFVRVSCGSDLRCMGRRQIVRIPDTGARGPFGSGRGQRARQVHQQRR
jgi:hypothetical protein